MATKKFLTYEGLATVVKRTASAITGVAATDNITLFLHGKEKNSNNKVVLTDAISNVIIPLANTTDGLAGLMSAEQAQKLASIEVNNKAEENQNAYSKFAIWKKPESTVADTILEAASKTDTLIIKAGENIELSATNDAAEGKDILTIVNTYKHPTHTSYGLFNIGDNQTPNFGGTFNIIDEVQSNSAGHVELVTVGAVKIPALPNVTVTDKGNTTADKAGNTIVEVVKAVSNGTTASNTGIYLDYTTVEVPTKGYVDSAIEDGIAASNAMVLKGSYSGRNSGDWVNTTKFSQGDTFVSTGSIEDGILGKLEPGDLIIAKKDEASKSTAADWIIVQKNVDVYDGTNTGLVPPKDTTAAADASKYLNQTGNWTVPAHLGIKVNDSDVYNTTTTGTFNLKAGTNLTITKGTATGTGANSVTPITIAVDMTKLAPIDHKHTITANGTGDSWISVTPTSGELGVTYAISHIGPGPKKSTYEASSTGSSNLVMGTSCVVTGVEYDDKGHIVGITSGKLPADQKGVTSVTITQGTGITVSDSGKAITESGTRTISLNTAAEGHLGGIALGYAEDTNNFAVKTTNENKAYVTIPEISIDEIKALFTLTA